MRTINVGVVGCGIRAQEAHLPVILEAQRTGHVKLIGVCDVMPQVAQEIGEKHHVPYYASFADMLKGEKDLDLVSICTADHTHHTLGKLAAENGVHVLMEKPMAMTLPCCDVLIQACKKSGVYYEVAEQYFRCPTDRLVVKLLQNGVIGEVLRAYALDPTPLPPTPSRSGLCMDMGVHRMSEIRTYLGVQPKQVMGIMKKFALQKQTPGLLQEDWGFATVEFEKDKVGACECATTIFENPEEDSYRQIVGTEGIIHIDARGTVIEGNISLRRREQDKFVNIPVMKQRVRMRVSSGGLVSSLRGYKVLDHIIAKTDPEIVWKNPYTQYRITDSRIGVMDALMSITNAIRQDTPPEYGIHARNDVEMCVAWYESNLTGKAIQLPITSMTTYETRVHKDYRETLGHDPVDL